MALVKKSNNCGPHLTNRKDENDDVNKVNKLKKVDLKTFGNSKRAAFSDLQNRGDVLNIGNNDAQKDKNKKIQLGKVKSCVDEIGKKTVISSSTSILKSQNPLTRSSSLRLVTKKSTNTKTIGSILPFRTTNEGLGLQKKNAVASTKLAENKIQQVKCISKPQTKEKLNTKVLENPLGKIRENVCVNKQQTKLKSTHPLRERDRSVGKTATVLNVVAVATKDLVMPLDAVSIKLLKKSDKEKTKTELQKTKTNLILTEIPTVTHSSTILDCFENIDVNDGDNLLLVSDYVNDIYNYLYLLEDEFPIRSDHLKNQTDVFPKMRAVLIDWINEVHLQFHLAIETYQMTVAIIDRYLQNTLDTARKNLQLVGVTALFIAAKYEELFPPLISDFVYITDDTYTVTQILQMELKIFKALDCNLSRPLPIHFLRRFSKAAKAEDRHHAMSKYFLELVSIEYEFASIKPSEIAASSLFLSLQLLQDSAEKKIGYNDKLWTSTLRRYTPYTATDLRPISQKIATLARNARNAKLKAVFTKYQSSKFEKISLHPILYSPFIDSLININKH